MEFAKNLFGFGDGEAIGADRDHSESESYCERMGKACAGVCVGLVMFIAAFGVIGWNEQRSVQQYRALVAGEEAVVPLECSPVDFEKVSELVYVSCPLTNLLELSAPTPFQTVVGNHTAVFLDSTEEMYQWVETKKTTSKKNRVGGGTTKTTTYSYNKGWKTTIQSSSSFNDQTGHQNPSSFPTPNFEKQTSPEAKVGDYKLSTAQIGKFTSASDVTLTDDGTFTEDTANKPPTSLNLTNTHVDGGYLHTGSNGSPSVGDVRVKWRASTATQASVIAQLTDDGSFKSWASSGSSVDLFSEGLKTKEELFTKAHEDNKTLTWILRFAGFGAMWMGLQLITGPLSLLPDIIPFVGPCLGDLVGCLLCVATFFIATFFSLLTIAIAWVIVRPRIGIPLLVGAIAALALFIGMRWYMGNKKKDKKKKNKIEEEQSQYGNPNGAYGGQGGQAYGAPGPYGNQGYPPQQGYGPPQQQGYGAPQQGYQPYPPQQQQAYGGGGGGYNPNFPPQQGYGAPPPGYRGGEDEN